MRTPIVRSTREEIKQKLFTLYSNNLDLSRNVLDFDKKPERYNFQTQLLTGIKSFQSLGQDDGGTQKYCSQVKQESLLKVEKSVVNSTNLTRDLEVLGRTPYQIGVDGEKFRVVAATLQKCNSPFVRRTFHFTSNGIVEAPEKKNETECVNIIPFVKQTKTVVPPQKFVRIRRFRVIKKNDLAMEKYILPQKIKITNGEKTRFLTVRIRPKSSNIIPGENKMMEVSQPGVEKTVTTVDEEPEDIEPVQLDDVEEINPNVSEPDTSSASLDLNEEDLNAKIEEVQQIKQEETSKEEKTESVETFNCDNCGKHFPTYLSCLAHIRSHQREVCQFCSKKFLSVKMLRDHIKVHHQERMPKSGTAEDRITTATSKFGRTRRVLNVAGLRSKYKML